MKLKKIKYYTETAKDFFLAWLWFWSAWAALLGTLWLFCLTWEAMNF